MTENSAYVYIMASKSGTLYTGVTNNIERRVLEHKEGLNEGFTKKYHCHKLVYFEEIGDIGEAILREKRIKGWSRSKKANLIRSLNPPWEDLAKDWRRDVSA
jgi:putative endonuclease